MSTKTFNNVKAYFTFTTATTHTDNITSGENLANSLGKISKWFTDFNSVVWTGDAATVNGHTVNSDVPAGAEYTDTTYTFSEGTTNGKFNVSVNGGTATPVTVHGLGTAAYTASTAYATASHTHTVANITDIATNYAAKTHTHAITEVTNLSDTLAAKAAIASPAFTGTPTAPTATAGTNTTQLATTAFVQSAISSGIAASDAMIFKGTLGTSGTITALPTTYYIGWTYRVITAGTYAGATCEVGDLIIALVDRAGTGNVNADWTVAQTNIDGAITTAGSGLSKSGTTINHSNSVSAVTTASLLKVKYDEQGHVTGSAAIAKADITGLGIPAQDTTYNIFTGATAASAGTAGLVPIPAAGYQGTFLRGDGTWTSEPVVAADTLVLNCIAD